MCTCIYISVYVYIYIHTYIYILYIYLYILYCFDPRCYTRPLGVSAIPPSRGLPVHLVPFICLGLPSTRAPPLCAASTGGVASIT